MANPYERLYVVFRTDGGQFRSDILSAKHVHSPWYSLDGTPTPAYVCKLDRLVCGGVGRFGDQRLDWAQNEALDGIHCSGLSFRWCDRLLEPI